jgi:hypothetical protein
VCVVRFATIIWRGARSGATGTTSQMPWLIKGLLVLAKSKRGRELLFAGGLAAVEIARSERARKLYSQAGSAVTDPALREPVTRAARKVAERIRTQSSTRPNP